MNILAIGAHPDDIELGCGGTLVKHVAAGHTVTMLIITIGETGPGDVSQRRAEQEEAARVMGVANVVFGEFPDGTVSNHELGLVHLIESVCREHKISTVYTHSPQDAHQDHRAVALASWGACRAVPQVLQYDSPSSIGFDPTVYVDITDTLDKKISALMCHISQVKDSAMASPHLVRTQAGYRGHHARVEAAEAFMPQRMLIDI